MGLKCSIGTASGGRIHLGPSSDILSGEDNINSRNYDQLTYMVLLFKLKIR